MNTPIKGRWKRFAEKVAEGHTATEAYIQAGYQSAKRETAHRAASRLYARAEIRAYVWQLRQAADEHARLATTLTIAEKLAFLARVVKTSSANLDPGDELIQSHRHLKDGSASYRLPCKLKALKMHSELAGHFTPQPPEQIPPVDPLQELVDQIRKMAGESTPVPRAAGETKVESQDYQSRDCGTNDSPEQSFQPLPTTTFRDQEPTPQSEPPNTISSLPLCKPSPLRPVDVRRLVLADIQRINALHHYVPSFSAAPNRP